MRRQTFSKRHANGAELAARRFDDDDDDASQKSSTMPRTASPSPESCAATLDLPPPRIHRTGKPFPTAWPLFTIA
jgi:hypothetical protein